MVRGRVVTGRGEGRFRRPVSSGSPSTLAPEKKMRMKKRTKTFSRLFKSQARVQAGDPDMKLTLSLLALVAFASSAFAQGKVDFQTSDTVKSVLERQAGQKVELRLKSGEKLAGKVEKVGEKTAHFSAVSGQEFFDAVVVLDDVVAVLVRTK